MQQIKKVFLQSALILSVSFLIVFISEFLVRGDGSTVFLWMKYQDLEFGSTLLFVMGLIIILAAVCGRLSYGYLCLVIPVCTISIVNYYKIDMKGEMLSLQDFALAGELATMAGDLEIEISLHLIIGVGLALLIFCYSIK